MINAVGRDIPDYLLTDGREVYQGRNYKDGQYIKKASPTVKRGEKPMRAKSVRQFVKLVNGVEHMTE